MRWQVMGRAYVGWLVGGMLQCAVGAGLFGLLCGCMAMMNDRRPIPLIAITMGAGALYRLALELIGRNITLSRARPTRAYTRYDNTIRPAPPACLSHTSFPNPGEWSAEAIRVMPWPEEGPMTLLCIECTTPAKWPGRPAHIVVFAAPANLAEAIGTMLEQPVG